MLEPYTLLFAISHAILLCYCRCACSCTFSHASAKETTLGSCVEPISPGRSQRHRFWSCNRETARQINDTIRSLITPGVVMYWLARSRFTTPFSAPNYACAWDRRYVSASISDWTGRPIKQPGSKQLGASRNLC